MSIWTRLSAILLLATGVAALAQAAAPVPEKPYRMVWVAAFVVDPLSEGPLAPGMIRRARILDGVPGWLDEADAPIAAWRKTEQEGSALLRLEFDGAGRVSGCRAEGVSANNPAPLAWAADLCPFVAQRARVSPALRKDGATMPDQVQLFIEFKTQYAYGPRSGPLVQLNLPAPMMVTHSSEPVVSLKQWPPSRDWLRYAARPPLFSGKVEQPGGKPLSGPLIGVEIAEPMSGDLACRVVRSSGNARLDARACDHVVRKLKPAWAENVRFPVRRWALLMAPSGKGFRVINADPRAWRPLVPQAGERERLENLWRGQANGTKAVSIKGDVSAEGRGITCIIQRSSGNDAADVAACRLFVEEARFALARDVFGQPISPDRILFFEFSAD